MSEFEGRARLLVPSDLTASARACQPFSESADCRHACRYAKQARLFKEMEEEAFPAFLTGPPSGAADGDVAVKRWADAGLEVGKGVRKDGSARVLSDMDGGDDQGAKHRKGMNRAVGTAGDEESSVSTGACSSSSSASALCETTRQSATGDVPDALLIPTPSTAPNAPFHRVSFYSSIKHLSVRAPAEPEYEHL